MIPARPVMTLLFALSACGGGAEEAANERKTAAGEVLGGSISDAMLPLDTVQSQGPPLREAPRGEAGAAVTAGEGDAPAAPPTPETTPAPVASAATPPEE